MKTDDMGRTDEPTQDTGWDLERTGESLLSGVIPAKFHRELDETAVERRQAYHDYVRLLLEQARDRRQALEAADTREHDRALRRSANVTARATVWIAALTFATLIAGLLPHLPGLLQLLRR